MALKPVKLEGPTDAAAAATGAARPEAAASPDASPIPEVVAARRGPDIRRVILPGVGAVVGLVVLGLAGNWFLNGRFEVKTDNAYIRADITNVASKILGYVETVHVKSNQQVKTGDLLVSLESSDYAARVSEAKAALAQAEADAAQSKARIAAQRSRLNETTAAAAAAEAQAEWSKSDAKRLAELADKGWYPKARLQQAEATQRTTTAQSDAAGASVRQAHDELAAAESSSTSADAKVEAARARLAAAEIDLSRTEIRAPIDGVIANNVLVKGALLSPGQVGMSIVPAADAYIIANFKETQVRQMAPGQCVDIRVDAVPGLKVTGRVDSLAPATGATFSLIPQDTATGNFTKIVQRVPVKILIDRKWLDTGLMRAGLAVEPTVVTRPGKTCS